MPRVLPLLLLLALAAFTHAMDEKFAQAYKLMQRRDLVKCRTETLEDCTERELAYIHGHEGEPEGPILTWLRLFFRRYGIGEWHGAGTSDDNLMGEMQKLARKDSRQMEDEAALWWGVAPPSPRSARMERGSHASLGSATARRFLSV